MKKARRGKVSWPLHVKFLGMAKFTIVLILLACFQVSPKGFSQGNITLSEKDAPLEIIFKEIERQTTYKLLYRTEWLVNAESIDIHISQASINKVLKICLRNQPLSYVVIGTFVVVRPKTTQNILVITSKPAKLIEIQGPVFNERGQCLKGITIITGQNNNYLRTEPDSGNLPFTGEFNRIIKGLIVLIACLFLGFMSIKCWHILMNPNKYNRKIFNLAIKIYYSLVLIALSILTFCFGSHFFINLLPRLRL